MHFNPENAESWYAYHQAYKMVSRLVCSYVQSQSKATFWQTLIPFFLEKIKNVLKQALKAGTWSSQISYVTCVVKEITVNVKSALPKKWATQSLIHKFNKEINIISVAISHHEAMVHSHQTFL